MGKLTRTEAQLLSQALLKGDQKVVRSLLNLIGGGDLRVPPRKNRPASETPLMLAAEGGHAPVLRLLIALGADVYATNQFKQPALLYAVRGNHLSVTKVLLQNGADPNVEMVDGDFVLREAAVKGVDLGITRALLQCGADTSMANKMGSTALHIAAFQGRVDVAKLLIRAGADVNHRDRHGQGPLTCAISRNQGEIARLLIQHGADPRLQPEALGVAAWEGKLALVNLLVKNGWHVRSKSHQGRTPLEHARNRRHKAVVTALMKAGMS